LKRVIKFFFPQKIIEKGIFIIAKTFLPYFKYKYGIKVRKNTSDFEVYRDIFILKHYNFPYKKKPGLIVDCGAYVGYSSIFFSTRFPGSKILAFEPSSSNFEILRQNTAKYPGISIFKKGIWPRKAYLKVIDNKSGNYSFSVIESDKTDFDVESVTIDDIIQSSGFDKIDILKMDIEGSEFEIFSQPEISWLEKTDTIIFEFHDRIRPGCSETVFKKFDLKKYNVITKGEYTIFQKK
jgi:FkbM family methyltransferase